MPIKTWMIYGATGYSGRLITEKALEKGLSCAKCYFSDEKVPLLSTDP